MSGDIPQRVAIIDLGSNSARVIVMNYRTGHAYHLEDEIREVVRLREGMTGRGLSEPAMNRGLLTLRLFKRFAESVGAEQVIATATSAVREAKNGDEFLERVEQEVGLPLRVLTGEEEARYGVLGALNAVPFDEGVVLDIGGGSAQVSHVQERRFRHGQALPLGALALTERFVRNDPIRRKEYLMVQEEIDRQFDQVPWLKAASGPLVGVGGTIRNLAKIEAARQRYPLDTIGGFPLSRASVAETVRQLSELPLHERRKLPGLKSDRADIILPGAMVLNTLMERLGVEETVVSENGLREGLFFEEFWSELPYPAHPDLREFSVLNMARFYKYQERHATHVRLLSHRLFEQLAALHEYGSEEEALLLAAALLHDLGTIINYYDHHKHSETLIASSGLPGFSPRERALIALIARYHRKGTPSLLHYAPLLRPEDETLVARMAALLRLAEYLERGRSGVVRDVLVSWTYTTLTLTLIADEYPAVELWDTERNAAELVASVYGRRVQLNWAASI